MELSCLCSHFRSTYLPTQKSNETFTVGFNLLHFFLYWEKPAIGFYLSKTNPGLGTAEQAPLYSLILWMGELFFHDIILWREFTRAYADYNGKVSPKYTLAVKNTDKSEAKH